MNMMDRGKYSGDNWAIMTSVEQKEVEKQGFSFLQNEIICCGDCNKPLVEVVKVKESEQTTALMVKCPYCGDNSFWCKVKGKIYIQAIEGLYMAECPTVVQNDIIYSKIEVKKNE